MQERPTYKISVKPDGDDKVNLGWYETAFVSNPAIMVKGMAFGSVDQIEGRKLFSESKKMRIAAPVMIPNIEIPRRDEESGELYNVVFPDEVVEELHSKFMQGLNNTNIFNLEHNEAAKVPAYFLEMWIVEKPKLDKSFTTYGIEVPKGTLFAVAQITDKGFFNSIVENEQFAFSIEAFLNLKLNKHKTNMSKLPNGQFSLDGKTFEVIDNVITEVLLTEEKTEDNKEGETVEVENCECDEKKPEQLEEVEEVKVEEVEATEETKEETKEEDLAVEETDEVLNERVSAIVLPLLETFKEDVLEILAEFKTTNEPEEEEAAEPQQMSALNKFTQISKFLRNE